MSTELDQFVITHCIKSPAASIPVVELWRAYCNWLGAKARRWKRSQLIEQLTIVGVRFANENGREIAVGIGLPMLVADGKIYRLA